MPDLIEKFSDEEVVTKTRLENQEFYAVIIERYQKKLLRYVFNLVKNEDKATDIVQETFIKGFINLNSFDIKKKFSSWIYRIAHNETINIIKKHEKEISLSDDFEIESDENVEKDFEKRETKERVEECLNKIPIIYSEPMSLYYLEEKSYEEISDILQIPMGTVATRISRAKSLMKKLCLTK